MMRTLNFHSFTKLLIIAGLSWVAITHASIAEAQVEVRLEFVAFNEDFSQYVVRFQDNQRGTTIQIRETKTGAIKKNYMVTDTEDERKRLRRLRRRFPVTGHVDQIGPKGRHTIMGAPSGKKCYELLVRKGKRFGKLTSLKLKEDETTEKRATGMLKSIIWAPTGRFLLAIVNQKIVLETGELDIDNVHYVAFKPWSVKWFKPDATETNESETTP
jgi:hypothetical protein